MRTLREYTDCALFESVAKGVTNNVTVIGWISFRPMSTTLITALVIPAGRFTVLYCTWM